MKDLTEASLAQFYGTDNWIQHQLNRNLLYTDGVDYMAEHGEAYWLIDEIAIANLYNKTLKREEFQSWTLLRAPGSTKAVLNCTDGNGHVLYTKPIAFTDFPLERINLYFENNVLCLPAER